MRKIVSSLRLYIVVLVLLALGSFILQPIGVWGQVNTTQFPSFLNYAQPIQFNYPFSSISQNFYPSGSSGLGMFNSNPTLYNSPFSTNLYNPSLSSIMGPGGGFYNPIGNYPNLNYPSSTFLFPRIPNIISSPNFPTTFPPVQVFPPVLFPAPINIPTIPFPSPYPSPYPFPFPPQPAPKPQPEPQKLFQSEFTNAAWGYQHEGWYINDDGKVYSFKNKGNSPEDGDEIEFVHTIDPIILEEKRSLIAAASQGPYSERINTAFDAGSLVYSAFLGNNEILLRETGDYTQENQSSSAIAILAWLLEIEAELNQ
jgi:hypothetical protein